MDYSLNVVDNVLADAMVDSSDFYEFSTSLDQLSALLLDADMYFEKLDNVGSNRSIKRQVGKIAKNTVSTTKDVGKLYGDVTDAGGGVIKGMWDLSMKLLGLAAKVIKFVFKQIERMPYLIINCMNTVGAIPQDIRDKIRGNIKLHVTVEDIRILYSNDLMTHIVTFCDACEALSQGEIWRSVLKLGQGENAVEQLIKIQFSDSDKKYAKLVLHEYEKFRRVQFTESRIDMDNPANVKTYFSTEQLIKFTDISGQLHTANYYQALEQIMKDLNSKINKLTKIRDDLSKKFEHAEMYQSFAKISPDTRKTIVNSLQCVTKGIEVIGNLVKCVALDVDMLRNTTGKLLNRQNNPKKKPTARDQALGSMKVNQNIYDDQNNQ